MPLVHSQLSVRFGQLYQAPRYLTEYEQARLRACFPTEVGDEIAMVEHTAYPQRVLVVTGQDLKNDAFVKIQSDIVQAKREAREGKSDEAQQTTQKFKTAIKKLYEQASQLPIGILTNVSPPKIEPDVLIVE